MVKKLILCFTFFFSLSLSAGDVPLEFESPAQEQRFKNLIEELRCLVCQNQSLSDSNADLAQDLRDEVHEQMNKGLSNDEIVSFLVERYGDFVLYRPPLKKTTWLLWFGPFLLLILAVFIVVRLVSSNSRAPQETLNREQKEKVQSLLQGDDKGDKNS